MADVTAVFFTDTFDGIIFGINDFIVRANLRQEGYDSFAQFSLGIFANEYSYCCILVYDFQHTVEEFCRMDRFCSDPVLFFPVAHCVGVCCTILVACAYEIVDGVFAVSFCIRFAEFVCCLFHFHQTFCQVLVHFSVECIVFIKFACIFHEAVCCHEKFQLFIGGIGNAPVHHFCQSCCFLIDKAKYLRTCSLCFFHTVNHFDCAACYGGDNYDGTFADAVIACCNIFRCVFHEEVQRGHFLHVNFCLQTGGPCAADTQPADVLIAVCTDFIYDFFDLRTQCQGTLHAVDLRLFIKFQHTHHSPTFSF